MLRRLFFLFPDEQHAQRVVDQLVGRDIPIERIHAIAPNVKLKTLPQATLRQKNDTAFLIERFLWATNLAVFMLALIALGTTLVLGEIIWAMVCIGILAVTFVLGGQFFINVPNVHLTEFTDALSHGEILLMIDVPVNRVAEIEDFVHHKYPEAVVGGVSWSVDAFGL